MLNSHLEGKVNNLKPFLIPRYKGGNLIVELDEDDYNKGIQDLQFSIVDCLFLPRTSTAPTTMSLRSKLAATWGMESFKLVSLGGGLHHVIFLS